MRKGEKQAPVTLIKQWKRREGQKGKQPLRRVPMFDTPMLKVNAGNIKATSTHCDPRTYGTLAHAQVVTPLTAKARIGPLVD